MRELDIEPEIAGERLKLMVVDDEPDNLALLYRTFRREFEVFRADSGPAALRLLEEVGEMAIIISDQRMPRMNGTEFLSRTVEQFPDTIRILLTGYTDIADLVGAINTGKVFKYITKPWNPKDLRTIIMQAADTYQAVKQRTNELRRALRRESISNATTRAIRESLDYPSILQTVVRAIGQTFEADFCLLSSLEDTSTHLCAAQPQLSAENFYYPAEVQPENTGAEFGYLQQWLVNHSPPIGQIKLGSELLPATDSRSPTRLMIPLICQQELLAILLLHREYRENLPEPWAEEEIRLIEEVAEQAALAISQAKLYRRIQQQTNQMRAELSVARQIQTNLLRQDLPELDNIKIQAHCIPAQEIGGDFFEIYVHPQGDIWLAVGDVSGKGVPAALFMASAISLLRQELAQESSPAPDLVMKNLNHSLFNNLVSSNCFITLVLARYTPATQDLFYANAGHIYPMVWFHHQLQQDLKTQGTVTFEPTYLKVRGVPLGILPDWKAAAGQISLGTGAVLLLTSDGLTEAVLGEPQADGSGMMLHQAGLWRLVTQQQNGLNLQDLLLTIQSQTQVREDDQTVLSLEIL